MKCKNCKTKLVYHGNGHWSCQCSEEEEDVYIYPPKELLRKEEDE